MRHHLAIVLRKESGETQTYTDIGGLLPLSLQASFGVIRLSEFFGGLLEC
jgi:hypothetical protein